jgi:hypothetical protein
MQNVTSFSASLLNSLGGDTEKAADVANAALISISDNANKMGSDAESVTAAFQGFAKQQYQLLDNLKLGYGGSKTEMERLLKDAEAYRASMGETVEYEITNLADVYTAIGDIQEKLGIAGTTAKEASTTISGSANQMKAAWDNLLVSISSTESNVGEATKSFEETVDVFLNNLEPAIYRAIDGVASAIPSLAKKAVELLTEQLTKLIIEFIPTVLPSIIKFAIDLLLGTISGLVNGAINAIKEVFFIETEKLYVDSIETVKALRQWAEETGRNTEFFDRVIQKYESNLAILEKTAEQLDGSGENAFDGMSESLSESDEAAKKLKKSLLGFDELNILQTSLIEAAAEQNKINQSPVISPETPKTAVETFAETHPWKAPSVDELNNFKDGVQRFIPVLNNLTGEIELADEKSRFFNGNLDKYSLLLRDENGAIIQTDKYGESIIRASDYLNNYNGVLGIYGPKLDTISLLTKDNKDNTDLLKTSLGYLSESIGYVIGDFDGDHGLLMFLQKFNDKMKETSPFYAEYIAPVFDGIKEKAEKTTDVVKKFGEALAIAMGLSDTKTISQFDKEYFGDSPFAKYTMLSAEREEYNKQLRSGLIGGTIVPNPTPQNSASASGLPSDVASAIQNLVRQETTLQGVEVDISLSGTEAQFINYFAPKFETRLKYKGGNILTGGKK